MFFKVLRKRIFGMPLDEASFERRGFKGGKPQTRSHLDQVGRLFLQGYNMALEEGAPTTTLINRLEGLPLTMQGFAFEGAAMGLALLDYLTPWNRYRMSSFLDGAGANHLYIAYVGVGWAFARLPSSVERGMQSLDPVLKWLAVDGYGFHEGYFDPERYYKQQKIPTDLSAYGRRVFDQGLGRCLWFVNVGDIQRISATIEAFPNSRHADLWSGIGLACAYAGGVEQASLEALREAAGSHYPALAQGVTFAAQARVRAGNIADHTRLACQVLCNMSVESAAEITDMTRENLPTDEAVPAYEVWKQRIQQYFTDSNGFCGLKRNGTQMTQIDVIGMV